MKQRDGIKRDVPTPLLYAWCMGGRIFDLSPGQLDQLAECVRVSRWLSVPIARAQQAIDAQEVEHAHC